MQWGQNQFAANERERERERRDEMRLDKARLDDLVAKESSIIVHLN